MSTIISKSTQPHLYQIKSFINMNKIISVACSCGNNCSCNPCLCGACDTIDKTNICATCGDSCSCVSCQCPSGKTVAAIDASCGQCGDSCSCMDCHCESAQNFCHFNKTASQCH